MAKKVLVDWNVVKEFFDKDGLIGGSSPSNPNEIKVNDLHIGDGDVTTTDDHLARTTQNRSWFSPYLRVGTMREAVELDISMIGKLNEPAISVQYNKLKNLILSSTKKNDIIDILIDDLTKQKQNAEQ